MTPRHHLLNHCIDFHLWAYISCLTRHLAPLSSRRGSRIPRRPICSEGIRGEMDTWDIMYKFSMTRSCDPTDFGFFEDTHSNFGRHLGAVEPPCYFQPRTRIPKKPCLASDTHLDGPPRIRPPAMDKTTSQSMSREKRCVKQMILHIVVLENCLRGAFKVRRSRPTGFSPRAS